MVSPRSALLHVYVARVVTAGKKIQNGWNLRDDAQQGKQAVCAAAPVLFFPVVDPCEWNLVNDRPRACGPSLLTIE